MPRITFINGQYVKHAYATTHIEDRGYQFADGIYEVIAVVDRKLIDADMHIERLNRSLSEIRIEQPYPDTALRIIINEIIRRNRLDSGFVYIQVTRGVASRAFPFPDSAVPSITILAKQFDQRRFLKDNSKGVKVITHPDIRWRRPDIKSVSLLPNVLMKQKAVENDAFEAILIDDSGYVTEGCSANVWRLSQDGVLQTHPANNSILNGITRLRHLELAKQQGYEFVEKPFTLPELLESKEAFLTSSTCFVIPIIKVDDHKINKGKPGAFSKRLAGDYLKFIEGGH